MTEQDPWHPEAFLQNRYTRAYRKLVEWAKTQQRSKRGHAEHHIVPKSFYRSHRDDGWIDGDPDDPGNLVILTHREHAWCHILLALRMTEGPAKRKMSAPILFILSDDGSLRCSRLLASAWAAYTIAHAERNQDPAFIARLSRANIEAQNRPEVAEKKRIAARKRNSDPSFKAKHAEATKIAMNTPEMRAMLSIKAKTRFSDPKVIDALAKSMRVLALEPGGIQERSRDDRVYCFTHEDGRTFTGTRWQMEDAYGLSRGLLKPLFKTIASQTCHGWSVSTSIQSSQTEPKAY